MSVEFFETGEMLVKRPDREELLDIKRGKWKLDDIKALATELFEKARAAKDSSAMPDDPDYRGANSLLVSLIRQHLA